jgi:hypothetical protein
VGLPKRARAEQRAERHLARRDEPAARAALGCERGHLGGRRAWPVERGRRVASGRGGGVRGQTGEGGGLGFCVGVEIVIWGAAGPLLLLLLRFLLLLLLLLLLCLLLLMLLLLLLFSDAVARRGST